jgi:membrane associated rhomboid family serine protease
MFLVLPLRIQAANGSAAIPTANAVLIALNVIVFLLRDQLGLSLAVGRGSSLPTVLIYGFLHADAYHLLANMWVLWLFGNPVKCRLGNGWYLLAYLGTLLALGLFARLFSAVPLLGASGAIFAVLFLFFMLMPRAVVQVGYVALAPVTLLLGLVSRPGHWLFWLVRWDAVHVRAWVGLLVVPLLEVVNFWASGWRWNSLAHLLGLLCGVVIVLLLPTAITLRRRPEPMAA